MVLKSIQRSTIYWIKDAGTVWFGWNLLIELVVEIFPADREIGRCENSF
jgi:hypothetical protein